MSKIVPTKPLLIMLYGFPGAGKTYFARQLCNELHAAHIQGDRIRAELFEEPRYDKEENSVVGHLMDYMAEEFLSTGLSVVYDVNAKRAAQRHELREIARQHHAMPLLIWLQIDHESAFARASRRDRRQMDDRYSTSLDRATFETLSAGMQNPAPIEKYAVVSGKHVFKTQFSAVIKRMHELSLINSDHVADKVVKPGMVNLVPQTHDHQTGSAGPSHSPMTPPPRRDIIIR